MGEASSPPTTPDVFAHSRGAKRLPSLSHASHGHSRYPRGRAGGLCGFSRARPLRLALSLLLLAVGGWIVSAHYFSGESLGASLESRGPVAFPSDLGPTAPGFEPIVPREVVERGIVTRGARWRSARLVAKLRAGEPVLATAVGGSNAYGHGVSRTFVQRSWDWLNATYPNRGNTLLSAALPAMTSEYFGPCVDAQVPPNADVVLVEMLVNDGPAEWRHSHRRNYERLLRSLLARPAPPVVVPIMLFNHHWGQHAGVFTRSPEAEVSTFSLYYDLPWLSTRQAFFHANRARLPGARVSQHLLNDYVHLSQVGHDFVADMVIEYIRGEVGYHTAHPPPPPPPPPQPAAAGENDAEGGRRRILEDDQGGREGVPAAGDAAVSSERAPASASSVESRLAAARGAWGVRDLWQQGVAGGGAAGNALSSLASALAQSLAGRGDDRASADAASADRASADQASADASASSPSSSATDEEAAEAWVEEGSERPGTSWTSERARARAAAWARERASARASASQGVGVGERASADAPALSAPPAWGAGSVPSAEGASRPRVALEDAPELEDDGVPTLEDWSPPPPPSFPPPPPPAATSPPPPWEFLPVPPPPPVAPDEPDMTAMALRRMRELPPPMLPGLYDLKAERCFVGGALEGMTRRLDGFEWQAEAGDRRAIAERAGAKMDIVVDTRGPDGKASAVLLYTTKSFRRVANGSVKCVKGCKCKPVRLREAQRTVFATQDHADVIFPTAHEKCVLRVRVLESSVTGGHWFRVRALALSRQLAAHPERYPEFWFGEDLERAPELVPTSFLTYEKE